MKCIRAIRKSKDVEIGEIRRVDDKTAYNLVGNSWEYIPKSEWKNATRVVVEKTNESEEKKSKKTSNKTKKQNNG